MTDNDDTNSGRDEEIEALESAIKADAKTYKCLNAYDPTRAAKELRAKWYAHHRATGEELDPRKLIRAAEAHLADEAKRLSKATKKPEPADDKPEAKPKKPAAKKPPSTEERREAAARAFAKSAKDKPAKPAKKPPVKETVEQRRARIAKKFLTYRPEPKTEKAS